MYWNYRLIRTETDGEPWLAIHEVYYNEKNEPCNYTAEPVDVSGEDFEEIQSVLEGMAAALKKPALTDADFVSSLIDEG